VSPGEVAESFGAIGLGRSHPGTEGETVPARLPDTPGFAAPFATVTGRRCVRSGPPLVIMSLIERSFLDRPETQTVGRLPERPADGPGVRPRCRETCSRSKGMRNGPGRGRPGSPSDG